MRASLWVMLAFLSLIKMEVVKPRSKIVFSFL
jgi:hypothetical protein